MQILERIEQIRETEHQRLRLAVIAVGEALQEAQLEEHEEYEQSEALLRKVDLFGNPLPEQARPAPARRVDFGPVAAAWSRLEDVVLRRLDSWEEVLWPLVRRWANGDRVEAELQATATNLSASREKLELLLRTVRNEVLFLPALAEPMRQLFAVVAACDRAERDEVIPALLSGSRVTADRAEDSQTPGEVARALRAAGRARDIEPSPGPDPLKRLLRWVGLGRD